MRDLAVLTFLTLDGVMQAPAQPEEDTSGGFASGGWAAPYWPQVMDQVEEEAMAQPFDLLFGRRTYELFSAHWPNVDNSPHADKLNNARKYVVTTTLNQLDWQYSTPISGDVPAEVAGLKEQDGPLLQVHGSSELIQTLLSYDLVDELRLWTFPVVVGAGKRLFGEGASPADWELAKSRCTSDGVVMAIYRRANRLRG